MGSGKQRQSRASREATTGWAIDDEHRGRLGSILHKASVAADEERIEKALGWLSSQIDFALFRQSRAPRPTAKQVKRDIKKISEIVDRTKQALDKLGVHTRHCLALVDEETSSNPIDEARHQLDLLVRDCYKLDDHIIAIETGAPDSLANTTTAISAFLRPGGAGSKTKEATNHFAIACVQAFRKGTGMPALEKPRSGSGEWEPSQLREFLSECLSIPHDREVLLNDVFGRPSVRHLMAVARR